MLNEGAAPALPGGPAPTASASASLFASAINKAGGDQVSHTHLESVPRSHGPQQLVNRGIQKLIVRFPSQHPAPDNVEFGSAMQRLVREAQSIQKTMVCSFSD